MTFGLVDISKLELTTDLIDKFNKNPAVGALISTSRFAKESELIMALNKTKLLSNTLICLDIDCARNRILSIEPHIPIYQLCREYEQNNAKTLLTIRDLASKITKKLMDLNVDIYLSPALTTPNSMYSSNQADLSFHKNNIRVLSAWINFINRAGMLCCSKFNPEINYAAFNRIKLQISAIIHPETCKPNNLDFRGDLIPIFQHFPDNLSQTNSLKSTLSSSRIRETLTAIEF